MFKKTFDTVASGYDNPSVRFFLDSVPYLAHHLSLNGNEKVLDVATGTGNAALELARHLPRGWVHGIDFSKGMLARAEEKKEAQGLENVHFSEMDMQALQFPDGAFDVIVCCFGLFFVEEMALQLSHMVEKVRGGGKVAITSFCENLFSPQVKLFLDRIERYGAEVPPTTWTGADSPKKCRTLFQAAGLTNVTVFKEDLGYYLKDADQWWEILWNAGFRGLIEQLSEDRRERFKAEHLKEVDALVEASGLWLEVGVLYSIGLKSQ